MKYLIMILFSKIIICYYINEIKRNYSIIDLEESLSMKTEYLYTFLRIIIDYKNVFYLNEYFLQFSIHSLLALYILLVASSSNVSRLS